MKPVSNMQSLQLFNLIKNSKYAQVATPLSKDLRSLDRGSPTHQIIFTPKSSASRSTYGIKTALPNQVGFSHIVFNDIDNARSMPDVEKYSGFHYNRLKFQESGVVLRNYKNEHNPLFPSEVTKSGSIPALTKVDSVISKFKLDSRASIKDVEEIIRKNPNLHKQFKKWLLKKNPEIFLLPIPSRIEQLLKEFIETSSEIKKKEITVSDLVRKRGTQNSSMASKTQGTAGFSYTQKGRLTNTPNGVKHGVIAPGRLVGEREAAIGGFIASVNERSVQLQYNYSNNFPGRHSRQFVMPFKYSEAEIADDGKVRIYADGVKAGTWMSRADAVKDDRPGYKASNPHFRSVSERNSDGNTLQNLLQLISKD